MSYEDSVRFLSELYSLMCRAGMNKEYYGRRLDRLQTVSTWMDLIIAAGTAGSSISALTIWNNAYGRLIWGGFTIVSTLLAVAKPVLQLNKKIERYSRLFEGHSDNYSSLLVLASKIKRQADITDSCRNEFDLAEKKFILLSKEDDPVPNVKLIVACEDVIRKRHPNESVWFPTRPAA